MSMLDGPALEHALDVARRAALAASEPLLEWFGHPLLRVETKGDGTPVSRADRDAELAAVEVIRGDPRCGDLDVLGEEHGSDVVAGGTRYRWVIDPLDGTLSYTHGLPSWGTLIALEDVQRGRAVVAVAHLPVLHRTYSAIDGRGAYRDEQRVRVRETSSALDTIVTAPDRAVAELAGREGELRALRAAHSRVRGYWDCVGHVLVAEGALGAAWECCLAPWDIAATRLIVEEAGGTVLVQPSRHPETRDALLGAPEIVTELAPLLGFVPASD